MKTNLCHSYQTIADELLCKFRKKDAEIAALLANGDREGIRAYSEKIRKHFRARVPLNLDPCPLEPRVTGTVAGEGYVIEKTMLQTTPGSWLAVNLYRPAELKDSHPALLVPIGHDERSGKCSPELQIMCANFALLGFVVAVFDMIGQGERDMFPDMQRNAKQLEFATVDEHTHVALPLNMLGENLASFIMWDCTRVLDYVSALPYVDAARIGATGQSCGSVQSTYLAILDDRVSAISPIQPGGKNSFGVRGGVGDNEQTVFFLNEDFGVEYTDLLWAVFPKKLMLSFSARQSSLPAKRYVEQELLRLYAAAGDPADFAFHVADCGHEISRETRELAYTWFCGLWQNGGPVVERPVNVLPDEALRCFPAGFDNVTAYQLTARRLAHARRKTAQDGAPVAEQLRRVLNGYADAYTIDLLRVSPSGRQEFLLHTRRNDYIHCVYQPGDGLRAAEPLRVVIDTQDAVPPADGQPTLALQPFGTYYTGIKREFDYDTETLTMLAAFFNGQVPFCRRLVQVITAVTYGLTLAGGRIEEVELAGSGQGGLLALCAALYLPVRRVTAWQTIASFDRFFHNLHYVLEETSVVPGLVNVCDIPGIAEAVDAEVVFVDPLDEARRVMDAATAKALFGDAAALSWT